MTLAVEIALYPIVADILGRSERIKRVRDEMKTNRPEEGKFGRTGGTGEENLVGAQFSAAFGRHSSWTTYLQTEPK